MKQKKTPKQIAALIGIAVLVGMYVVTLVLALSGFEGWEKMFSGCVVSTVAIPILLWVFIWIYGKTKGGDGNDL